MKSAPALIKEFVNDVDSQFIFVRGRKLSRQLRVHELRTRKHRYLAIAYDELGNVFVLTNSGMRKQLHDFELRTNQ